jgi:dienelactone hydrolase
MKYFTSLFFFFFCLIAIKAQTDPDFTGETITFKADDGLKVTADLYMPHASSAPFIILYHQAGYSRGEYRAIAPKLNDLGFNCMAVDQRSGDKVNGVMNKTHQEAVRKKLPTEYLDALPDIEAAYLYVKYGIKPDKIILWGSSYSAAIMFYMGSVHHNNLSGILSFAPGAYFKINNKELKTYAARITCPVFVTSAKSEYKNWKAIYDEVRSEKSYFLPETEGKHGSKALWDSNPSHTSYWSAVQDFLNKVQ